MNPTMVLDFVNQQSQFRPLTEIGANIGGAIQTGTDNRNFRTAEEEYAADPNAKTLQNLYKASVPVGQFDAVRAGYLDTLEQPGDAPAMDPVIRARLLAERDDIGDQIAREGYKPELYMQYNQLSERAGLDTNAVEEARRRLDPFLPTGDSAANLQLPESYSTMRESWLANPYDSTAKANYLNAAQEASRVGFPGEVAAAQSQIDQFEASSEFNQEGYDQFLGLVESFGETGDLSFADQAAVLGQQLGLNSSTIDSMITRHITSQREVRQELAKGEWNEALDSAITTLEMGEELTEEEVDRLANFGVAAGMGTDTKSIVDNLYQRIDERREETLTDDVIRTTSALMDDPLDVRAGQAALAARMRQDPTQYSQTMQVIEELVSQGKQDEVDALVDQSLSIISPLESGNTERALKEIDGHISATQDPDEIQALQEMRQLIVDGKEDQVLEELILRTYAMGDSGVSAMEGLSDVREGTRRDTELEMRLIKMGTDLDLSQEGIDSLIARAKNDPVLGKTALKFLNYATAVSEDPNALDRVQEITLDRDVNKIWYDRTKHLVSVLRETDSVEEMAEMANSLDGGPSDANSPQVGVYDLALINTLQRLIDPATVREADITNMTATVGGVEGIRRLFNQLMSGEKFTPAQRRTMADVAIRLRNAYQTTVDEEIFPSVLAMSEVIGPMVPGSPRWKSIVGDYIPADQRPIRVED